MAAALPSDDAMRESVANSDADLQFVLQEAGASLATMYKVTLIHQTRRRFQAIADTRAQAREAALQRLTLELRMTHRRAGRRLRR